MASMRASRFGFALVVALSALLAASIAHVAIDLLGDVLLAHDAYDDVPHGTRGIAAALTLAAGAALAVRFVFFALGAVSAGRLRRVARARRLIPRASVGFFASVVTLALVVLVGMEALDAAAAGIDVDDPADLLGGSLALGMSTLIVCALGTAAAMRAALNAMAGVTLAVARAVRALAIRPAATGAPLAHHRRPRARARRAAVASSVSKRGPPAFSSAAA